MENELMSEFPLDEPSPTFRSVLRKRKRPTTVETIGGELTEAKTMRKKEIPSVPDFMHESINTSSLETHPDYPFWVTVAGHIPDTSVKDLLGDGESYSELEDIKLDIRASRIALLENMEVLGRLIEEAEALNEDDAGAQEVFQILTKRKKVSSVFRTQLELLLRVRRYFAQHAGNSSELNDLLRNVETNFAALPLEPTEHGLSIWLHENGADILDGKYVPDVPIGGKEGDLEGMSATPGRSSTRRSAVFSADTEYYISEESIRQALSNLTEAPGGLNALRAVMQEYDDFFQTENVEDGAWQLITSRNKIVEELRKKMIAATKEVPRLLDRLASAIQAYNQFLGSHAETTTLSQDLPLPLKPMYVTALANAVVQVQSGNPNGFTNVTSRALMRSAEMPRTIFADIVAMEILKVRLNYPDRYRPVLTQAVIANNLVTYQRNLASYEYRGGSVIKYRP